MVGRTIQHYQIVETLGRGGMGVVYKAKDTHLDRFIAIKVLPPEKVADTKESGDVRRYGATLSKAIPGRRRHRR
jgi:serine/threonine protein kinase